MGAGPELDGWDSSYPLIIDSLAKQGFTNSRAFSMDLRGFSSAKGELLEQRCGRAQDPIY